MTIETELPAVKVNALEWAAVGNRFDAHTFFGIYSVCDLGNYVHLRLHPGMEGAHVGEAYHSETLDKAKAAAQADYERRILSALVPSTHAESRCEELVKALEAAKKRMRNCRGAIESNQVVDKDVHGSLTRGMADIDAVLKELPDVGVWNGRVG